MLCREVVKPRDRRREWIFFLLGATGLLTIACALSLVLAMRVFGRSESPLSPCAEGWGRMKDGRCAPVIDCSVLVTAWQAEACGSVAAIALPDEPDLLSATALSGTGR